MLDTAIENRIQDDPFVLGGRTFRSRLMEQLCQFADPAMGGRVVTQVWTREEAFAGPQMEAAPDLTLALRDGGFVSILKSDMVLKPRPEVVGTHRPQGILMAKGPGIRQGLSLPAVSITDVAPTLLYMLGLPVPSDLEGRVAEQIFTSALLQERPIRIGGATRFAVRDQAHGPRHDVAAVVPLG
jgi:hypothetical protein